MDDTGDTEVALAPQLALRRLRHEAENGKWIYVNGKEVHKTIGSLRAEELLEAQDEIVVTEPQVGG